MKTYYIGCWGIMNAYYNFMDAVDKLKKYDIIFKYFTPARIIDIMDYRIIFIDETDILKTTGIRELYGAFDTVIKEILDDLKKRNDKLAKANEELMKPTEELRDICKNL